MDLRHLIVDELQSLPVCDSDGCDLSPTSTLVLQSPPELAEPSLGPAGKSPQGGYLDDTAAQGGLRGKFLPQSPIFHLSAAHDASPPDIILVSGDGLAFYVHRHRLVKRSSNNFAGLLSVPCSMAHLSGSPAVVVHIVLCVIYDTWYMLSTTPFHLHDLAVSIRALAHYGIDAKEVVAIRKPLMEVLLNHVYFNPLEVFAIAAENDLEALAVHASPYLLSHNPFCLDPETARRIGCKYMMRLQQLRSTRTAYLRNLLLGSRAVHRPTATCSMADQEAFGRAWTSVIASLAWKGTPDITAALLKRTLDEVLLHAQCPDCHKLATTRIKDIVKKWNAIPVHI